MTETTAIGERIIEQDGCFRLVEADGDLWVEEVRHGREPSPVRLRLRFQALPTARSYLAGLRPGHDRAYHGRVADLP